MKNTGSMVLNYQFIDLQICCFAACKAFYCASQNAALLSEGFFAAQQKSTFFFSMKNTRMNAWPFPTIHPIFHENEKHSKFPRKSRKR